MSRRCSTFLVVGYSPVSRSGPSGNNQPADLHATVHTLATERDGRIVETTSRDLVAAFPSPAAALACALALQSQTAAKGDDLALAGWDRRLGIDAAAAENEAAYDEAIAEARRLRETAEAGGIRISPAVHAAARSSLGLEWDRSDGQYSDSTHVPAPCVVATTRRTGMPPAGPPPHAQRRAVAAAAAVVLSVACLASWGFAVARRPAAPAYSGYPGSQWEPLGVRVHEARIGGLAFPHPLMRQDRARVLLNIGVTNRTAQEVELRREDFRLEIGGREVAALPPLGWSTRHDDAALFMTVGPEAARQAFRFDRQPLLPGGSAIVGLQFDFPLEALEGDEFTPRFQLRLHPFARWTNGMVVERLGSDAPGLWYRGPAGHTRIDLSDGPFGNLAPLARPSQLGGAVAVYEIRQPVHVFNAHRLWRFIELHLSQQGRPIVVDMRRWPAPDLAVRAFLESRIHRDRRPNVAFVANGTPRGLTGAVFGVRGANAPEVWFGRESDAAAYLIGRSYGSSARLRDLLRSPDVEIREAAVYALGRVGTEPASHRTLARMLKDPASSVRVAAARALARGRLPSRGRR